MRVKKNMRHHLNITAGDPPEVEEANRKKDEKKRWDGFGRPPSAPPPPPVPVYDPYPWEKDKPDEQKASAAAPSLSALRAENARLRAEIAQHRNASKAPAAPRGPKLLTGREREEMDRAMGIVSSRVQGPHVDEQGRFAVGVETPTQTRARLARERRAV